MEIGGVPIDMVLDTGALASTIPESVGTRAGLDGRALAYPMVLHSAAGQILVRKVFLGELRLGALGIHPLELASMSSVGRRAPFGLLGLDVLSRFHVRVEPGVRLWLRPRRDLGITAAERLARWSFLPSCKRLGCLEASVEAVGEDAVVHVTYETDLARPLDVLFSCASNPGQPTAGTTLASDALVRAPRQLRLRVPAGFPGEPASVKVRRGGAWFGSGGAGCADLAVVDLSPASLEPRDAAVDDPAGGSVAAGELQVAFRP
ncbi:MAG: retroviral-like aspartic protease family protein [Myxococcales bacterium]|nr:retroviral-like aspartic protease family protein [Myxococcales bacterium]